MAKQEEAKTFTRMLLLEKIEQAELAVRNQQRALEEARNALFWLDGDHPSPKKEQRGTEMADGQGSTSVSPVPDVCLGLDTSEGNRCSDGQSEEGELPGPMQHELIRLIDAMKAKKIDVKSIWTFTWKDLHDLAVSLGMHFDPTKFRNALNRIGKAGIGCHVGSKEKGAGRRPSHFFPNREDWDAEPKRPKATKTSANAQKCTTKRQARS